ncbi:MAG TPA: Gfo/Idh/MocA family oxidoreductase [Fimbriimonas sp.]|nr:Gfo/Idh/MocA family oxidoreductase [Fimbriimonas sp.]
MNPVRIGFVGAGGIANAHAEALAKVPDAKIVGVTDVSSAAAEKLADKVGAQVFDSAADLGKSGLDALFILLPPFAHGEAERAALDNNLPFFVEKPLGLDLGFCNEIAAEAGRKGLMTSSGYMNRYRQSIQTARQLLQEEPGIMSYGGWWGGTPGGGGHWWPDKSKSGGQFHEQVTHTVDVARYLLGEAVEVYAAAAHGFVKDLPGYSMDDAASVTIRFANGAVATLMSSVTSNACGGVFLNLHSMNRTFRFRDWEHSLTLLAKGQETREIPGEPDIFSIEDAAFVKAVQTKDPSGIKSDYADGVKTAAISLAANESIATGKPVSLV